MRGSLSRLAQYIPSSSIEPLYRPIPLFRRILRAHRNLPPDMRALGDDYAKAEFRRHRKVTNQAHIIGFLAQWTMYVDEMPRDKDAKYVGKKLNPTVYEQMSNEQLGQLRALMHAAKDVWKPAKES